MKRTRSTSTTVATSESSLCPGTVKRLRRADHVDMSEAQTNLKLRKQNAVSGHDDGIREGSANKNINEKRMYVRDDSGYSSIELDYDTENDTKVSDDSDRDIEETAPGRKGVSNDEGLEKDNRHDSDIAETGHCRKGVANDADFEKDNRYDSDIAETGHCRKGVSNDADLKKDNRYDSDIAETGHCRKGVANDADLEKDNSYTKKEHLGETSNTSVVNKEQNTNKVSKHIEAKFDQLENTNEVTKRNKAKFDQLENTNEVTKRNLKANSDQLENTNEVTKRNKANSDQLENTNELTKRNKANSDLLENTNRVSKRNEANSDQLENTNEVTKHNEAKFGVFDEDDKLVANDRRERFLRGPPTQLRQQHPTWTSQQLDMCDGASSITALGRGILSHVANKLNSNGKEKREIFINHPLKTESESGDRFGAYLESQESRRDNGFYVHRLRNIAHDSPACSMKITDKDEVVLINDIFVAEKSGQEVISIFSDVPVDGHTRFDLVLRRKTKSGKWLWIETSAVLAPDCRTENSATATLPRFRSAKGSSAFQVQQTKAVHLQIKGSLPSKYMVITSDQLSAQVDTGQRNNTIFQWYKISMDPRSGERHIQVALSDASKSMFIGFDEKTSKVVLQSQKTWFQLSQTGDDLTFYLNNGHMLGVDSVTFRFEAYAFTLNSYNIPKATDPRAFSTFTEYSASDIQHLDEPDGGCEQCKQCTIPSKHASTPPPTNHTSHMTV